MNYLPDNLIDYALSNSIVPFHWAEYSLYLLQYYQSMKEICRYLVFWYFNCFGQYLYRSLKPLYKAKFFITPIKGVFTNYLAAFAI